MLKKYAKTNANKLRKLNRGKWRKKGANGGKKGQMEQMGPKGLKDP